MKHLLLPLCFAVAAPLISACSTPGADYEPIIDGPRNINFQSDLSACQHLAASQKQLQHEGRAMTALGAGAGALLGSVEEDSDAGDVVGGALVGAAAGGLAAMNEHGEKREEIIQNCMKGRGHAVVG